jgi:hypothetical protein
MDADGCKQPTPLCFLEQEHECTLSKTTANDVVNMFNEFLRVYDKFREENGLPSSIDNIYESLTAMSDKHGRICRQIKHFEREDAKEDWTEGMIESLVGYMMYGIMALRKYDLDMSEGMKNELQTASEQHGNKNKQKDK